MKSMLRNGVMAVKERALHPERFSRDGFRLPVSTMKHHKVLTPKERIAARLQLVVWLKELEHELIRETLADAEGLREAREQGGPSSKQEQPK